MQVTAEPIGPVIDALRAVLDPWLGVPNRDRNEGRVTLNYRFASEDLPTLRLPSISSASDLDQKIGTRYI